MKENKRQIESHRKRLSVFEAAQSCFGELGYKGATVDLIADTAGVSKGTVFTFYDSKENLFAAVVEQSLKEITTTTQQQLKGLSCPDELLRITFLSGYDQCRQNNNMINQFRTDTRTTIVDVLKKYGNIWGDLFKEAIQTGIDLGQYNQRYCAQQSAEIIFELHMALINKMCDQEDTNAVPRPMMQQAINMFIHGLKN